ncbi:hypothetical protein AAON49_13640 [Pseudotenacibaculum sp. MALMAid0570]|uniref:hypothetical protein n=1 Tax=Pseudotenacibaculum sp. MALMAid0570 TaxID=3143938 RepID=UPI0032DF8C2A
MIISNKLEYFYKENNLPEKGGENDRFFFINLKLFTLKLPNPKFRRKVIHIHDVQHVLYDCDTTWKGESFISGWEIATGMWKHLPIGLFSLSGMGVGVFLHPKEVYLGYKKGLECIGVIDLKIPKEQLINLSVSELKTIIQKKKPSKLNWFSFLFWCFMGVLFNILPFLLLMIFFLF